MICTTQATAGSPLAISRLILLNAADDNPFPPHRRGVISDHTSSCSNVCNTSSVIDRWASPSGALRRNSGWICRTAAISPCSKPEVNSNALFMVAIPSFGNTEDAQDFAALERDDGKPLHVDFQNRFR